MKTVVGVLRGGPSREYEVSLKPGSSVLRSLDPEKFAAKDIFIDRAGVWHLHGAPVAPAQAMSGEDVAVQRVLDDLGVPYTGSGASASRLAFDKHHTKAEVKKLEVRTPRALVLTERPRDFEDAAFEIFRTFPHPAFVKPALGGSSVGASLADTYH